jgi:L-tartrate/succinate antiporter
MRGLRAAIPLAVGLIIAMLPAPSGLQPHAWRYLALFTATIVALVTEPMPAAAIGLISVTFAAAIGLPFSRDQLHDPAFRQPAEALKWALAGFVNPTVWLIFGAFVFAMGYQQTGLGRRIALVLVKRLGARTLGLGYAIALTDLALAPFTPSNTARSAGVIFPVIASIPPLYGSAPGSSARRIGSYLMWVAFAATCVTSSMFVTALAPNVLAVELVRKAVGVEIQWTDWFVGFLPVGALLLALLPWLVYRIYPPEVRTSREVPEWAARELEVLGGVTRNEWIMAILVVCALGLWVLGARLIDPTMVALVGISLMLLTGIVSWADVVGNTPAWNVLVWFATLIVLADGLNKVGVVDWFGRGATATLSGRHPLVVVTTLVALFFALHYLVAGLAAHTTALLPVIVAAGAGIADVPVRGFAMLLVYSLGLMGVLTPYACGPSAVYYESGYLPRGDFWRLGLIFGGVFLAALLIVGVPYLAR